MGLSASPVFSDAPASSGFEADAPHGLRVGGYMGYSRFSLTLETASSGTLEFAPRTVARPGFDVRYGAFGVALGMPEGAGGWPRPEASGLRDVRVHYHGKAFGVEAHHRVAEGFSGFAEASRARSEHPDMRLRSTGTMLFFAVGPDARASRLAEGRAESGGGVDVFLTVAASLAGVRAPEPLARDRSARAGSGRRGS